MPIVVPGPQLTDAMREKAFRLPIKKIDDCTWEVTGDTGTYTVTFIDKVYDCGCKSYEYRRICSHVACVILKAWTLLD